MLVNKKFLVLMTLVVVLMGGGMITPIQVEASSRICCEKDCHNRRYGKSVYCMDHDPAYQLAHVKCNKDGCSNYTAPGHGSYCAQHDPCARKSKTTTPQKGTYSNSNSNKSTKKSTYDSYDKGYNDVYEDSDYDDDRYRSNWRYSLGVDDALDEMDW